MPTAPYERYAAVYNETGQDAFSRRLQRTVAKLLADRGWRGRRVLDLACGTGTAVAAWADQGYTAMGLDLSRAMLLEARWRYDQSGLPWLHADLRQLPVATASVDLVTAFYDSVNYLTTTADLQQFMAEAARVLRREGRVVFDLNTPQTLQEHWTGVCHAQVGADLATVWRGEWRAAEEISSLRATFFVRGDDGRWDRFDEVHDEHGFSDDEIAKAAKAANLSWEHAEDLQSGKRPTRHSRRALYVLRQKHGPR
ncbi:MAG: class I SAM-dependent methyltransferase [Chloroflexi bacterium]|nr:class I SAM-dependent methyltransferase [Chloroflexota bacterium]